jgi:hypothetical protein
VDNPNDHEDQPDAWREAARADAPGTNEYEDGAAGFEAIDLPKDGGARDQELRGSLKAAEQDTEASLVRADQDGARMGVAPEARTTGAPAAGAEQLSDQQLGRLEQALDSPRADRQPAAPAEAGEDPPLVRGGSPDGDLVSGEPPDGRLVKNPDLAQGTGEALTRTGQNMQDRAEAIGDAAEATNAGPWGLNFDSGEVATTVQRAGTQVEKWGNDLSDWAGKRAAKRDEEPYR